MGQDFFFIIHVCDFILFFTHQVGKVFYFKKVPYNTLETKIIKGQIRSLSKATLNVDLPLIVLNCVTREVDQNLDPMFPILLFYPKAITSNSKGLVF